MIQDHFKVGQRIGWRDGSGSATAKQEFISAFALSRLGDSANDGIRCDGSPYYRFLTDHHDTSIGVSASNITHPMIVQVTIHQRDAGTRRSFPVSVILDGNNAFQLGFYIIRQAIVNRFGEGRHSRVLLNLLGILQTGFQDQSASEEEVVHPLH